jgi:hypothetical protein
MNHGRIIDIPQESSKRKWATDLSSIKAAKQPERDVQVWKNAPKTRFLGRSSLQIAGHRMFPLRKNMFFAKWASRFDLYAFSLQNGAATRCFSRKNSYMATRAWPWHPLPLL